MAGEHTCETTQAALRSHLLETLSEREQQAVAAHLEGCPACQEALEAERGRLAVLDALPRSVASPSLADRTLTRIRATNEDEASAAKARWLIYGAVASAAVLLIVSILPIFARAREAARRASTQGNMKQLGLIFKMYANESEGERFPDLAAVKNAWSPDLAWLYPDLMTDSRVLISEEHPERKALIHALEDALQKPNPDFRTAEQLAGESFGYLGYAVKNEAEFLALQQAKTSDKLPAEGAPVEEPKSGSMIPALREGVERFLITDINNPAGSADAQSVVPVVIEIATWKHKKSMKEYKGANVLYMDGHVEFVRHGKFPVVDSVLNALSGID